MSCKHDCPAPPLFPKLIFNRPALKSIDYRIGNYADVRGHLLDQLNKQAVLSSWTHRGTDDPGIALLEADAVVADILTFYQTLYANETYLRTAKWPQSITDLVRLSGYRLSPGVAGEATFALAVKGKLPVTVPMGFGLKAELDGIDKPVDFETREALDAIPALSEFNLYRPRITPPIENGTTVLRLSSLDVLLKADDRILLGEPVATFSNPSSLTKTQIVTVAETWDAFGYRYIKLKTPISRTTSVASLRAYKLGETLKHFGHNAPATIATVLNGVPSTRATPFLRQTNASTVSGDIAPSLSAKQLPLDREFKSIETGSTILIQGRLPYSSGTGVFSTGVFSMMGSSSLMSSASIISSASMLSSASIFESTASIYSPMFTSSRFTAVRKVTEVEDQSMQWGMQSGASTMLTLDSNLSVGSSSQVDIRSISVLQVTAAAFTVHAGHINSNASTGQSLRYFGSRDNAELLNGRRLLLVDADGETTEAHVDHVVTANISIDAFHTVVLDRSVDYADFEYELPKLQVFANIVDASQGKTLERVAIGSGNAGVLFQSFALPKAPLTYLFDAARTPAQTPALDLYVDGIRWKRLDTLFNAGAKCQVYIVREDSDGNSVVQFGDGKTGARLSTGRSNVEAAYRIGIGAHGTLKAGSKPQATGKLTGLDKVYLPVDVSTGADAESSDNARIAAPEKLQSLGRLVSIADYEAETRALPNVLKANAQWAAPEGTPLIALTVLTQSGSTVDLDQIRDALSGFNRCRGPARHAFTVINGRKQFVHVDVLVGYDPSRLVEDIEREIKLAIGVQGDEANGIDGKDGLFGLNRRDFHQSVHTSEIIAAIQNVRGVEWVHLRGAKTFAFASLLQPDPMLIPLPSLNLIPSPLLPCPTNCLLALHTRHLVLGFVSAQIQAECPT
jgi:hypothetical protein